MLEIFSRIIGKDNQFVISSMQNHSPVTIHALQTAYAICRIAWAIRQINPLTQTNEKIKEFIMKKRKIIGIILALTLFAQTFCSVAISQADRQVGRQVEFEPKIFADVTIDEDFCGRFILVVMDKNVGGLNKRHDARFFGNFPIKDIVDLTAHSEAQIIERNEAIRMNQRREETFRQILQIELPFDCKQNVLEVIARLENIDGIISAEPNFRGFFASSPSGYDSGHQWALERIHAPMAWGFDTGRNENVRVGIIDTGIADHVDFNRIAGNPATSIINRNLGRSFVNGVMQPAGTATGDTNGHGTMTAGVVSTGWNGVAGSVNGISGNVTLVPFKVDDGIGAWVNSTVAAINHATTTFNNANTRIPILNASLGWYRNPVPSGHPVIPAVGFNALHQAVIDYPGLFVAAAGNDGINNDGDNPMYPASFNLPNIISVGATDRNDVRSVWGARSSNFGANTVHLFAPGGQGLDINNFNQNIRTTHLNNRPLAYNGTSAAAPHVAGVAALILNKFGINTPPAQVKWAILEGVDKIQALNDRSITGGRLNAHGAILAMYRLQNLSNHDMTYGVHHIRNSNTNGYLDAWGTLHGGQVSLFPNYIDEDHDKHQRWIVQRIGNAWELRSYYPFSNGTNVARIINSGGNAITQGAVVNPTGNGNITVVREANNTVSFRIGNLALAAHATQGTAVWTTISNNNTSAAQRWFLDPHRLTHQRGDVVQNGTINQADIDRVNSFIRTTNPVIPTALEFFLADVTRDGALNQADVTAIRMIIEPFIPNGRYNIRGFYGGHLHVADSNTTTPLLLSTGSANNDNSRFVFERQANGYYRIRTAVGNSANSIGVRGPNFNSSGSELELQTWNSNNNSQLWRIEKYSGYYIITNRQSNRVIDLAHGWSHNGAFTWQWYRNHTQAQLFKLIPV